MRKSYWTPGKVITCTSCGQREWQPTEQAEKWKGLCTPCHKRKAKAASKVAKWKRNVAKWKRTSQNWDRFAIGSAMIAMRRDGMPFSLIAEVLETTENDVLNQWDMVLQDAT